ncbi:hypothetical protein B0T22DRAFT_108325 [Podospora appendiculata]|uniref:Uncharacterized protein n=1 Tax=Podospora appendiculata TaxID=314037 RepID=A0AAE0XL84_9PEZI|nr:hypothetical protein B0T22DRAFT_108325 [Podospora appendiculata]
MYLDKCMPGRQAINQHTIQNTKPLATMIPLKRLASIALGASVSLLFIPLSSSQQVPPDKSFDCSNTNFQVIYTACAAGDYTNCCAVGTDCCAGGCCDLLSVCVGVGTSKETCCDYSDVTHCGTGPDQPKPSVVCTGSSGLSSYKCPPGSTCNIHNDSCYPPQGGASSSDSSPQLPSTSSSSSAVSFLTAGLPASSSGSPDPVTVTVVPSLSSSSPAEGETRTVTVGGSSSSPGGGAVVTVTTGPPNPTGSVVTVGLPSASTSTSTTKSGAGVERVGGTVLVGMVLMGAVVLVVAI